MVLLPLHATPTDQPSAADSNPAADRMDWVWSMALGIAIAAALYVAGLIVLRREVIGGRCRAASRSCSADSGRLPLATMSALGTYDTVLFSIHMVQHMVLMMVAPMFLALGAPVTLALRTLPTRPRAVLRAVALAASPGADLRAADAGAVHRNAVRPLLLARSTRSRCARASGTRSCICISCSLAPADVAVAGHRPVPGRISYPLRLLMVFLMLPFHAFLGISIMSSTALIAESWYLAFNRSLATQSAGGSIPRGGDPLGLRRREALLMLGSVRPVVRGQPAGGPARGPST